MLHENQVLTPREVNRFFLDTFVTEQSNSRAWLRALANAHEVKPSVANSVTDIRKLKNSIRYYLDNAIEDDSKRNPNYRLLQ